MKTLLQIATDAGIKRVDLTRFTSDDVSALESSLRELFILSIVREAEDYEERVKDGKSGKKSIEGVLHSWITENNY